jgi:hypothetical protein
MDTYLLEQFGCFNAQQLASEIAQGDEVAAERLVKNGRKLAKQLENDLQQELYNELDFSADDRH